MWNRAARTTRRRERAFAEFSERIDELVAEFHAAAAESGTPQGLIWKAVRPVGNPLLAIKDGEIPVALMAVEVEFDADEDGDMEDAPGLDLVRSATVSFRLSEGSWRSDPKALFNLWPSNVVRLDPKLEPFVQPR